MATIGHDETTCPACGWTLLDDGNVEVVDLSTPDGEIVWVHEDCAKHDPTRFSTDLDTEMEDRK